MKAVAKKPTKKKAKKLSWTDQHGFTAKGAVLARKALPHMMAAMEILGDKYCGHRVLDEAYFRLFVLPTRTKKYQRDYLRNVE